MATHTLHVAMNGIIKDKVSTLLHCMEEDAPQASLEVTSHIGLRVAMIIKLQAHLGYCKKAHLPVRKFQYSVVEYTELKVQ
jgi:hypothetical protein